MIRSRKIAFVSVYAPATYDEIFIPRLTNELLSLNEYSLIIGGDMNAVLDLNQDRSGVSHMKAQKHILDMFNAVVESHHLTDIWRMHNPTKGHLSSTNQHCTNFGHTQKGQRSYRVLELQAHQPHWN
uniref:Endonuclease/exonuclease/phosphatase domain-containing protein n=1 Tax=Sander lucioperca TaxID=283035 RepID=A0A8D0CPC7_SANLU